MKDQELLERITINPKVMVGKPVIMGTRLTVEYILNLLALFFNFCFTVAIKGKAIFYHLIHLIYPCSGISNKCASPLIPLSEGDKHLLPLAGGEGGVPVS